MHRAGDTTQTTRLTSRTTGPMWRWIAAAAASVLLGVACTSTGTPNVPTQPTGPSGSQAPSTPPSASASPSASCVQQTFDGLTPEQRVGQLFVLGLPNDVLGSAELGAIRAHHIGSVSFTETTTEGVAGVRAVANELQAEATDAGTGGVRFFFAANQEGGEIQALRGTGFSTMPSAVEQGAIDPATLEADATTWGRQLAAAGVNLDFAPVMDVVPAGTESQNEPIGVLHREYGNDPATVGTHGSGFIRGMQRAGIATTAKHFPGLGRVKGNTDVVAGVVDTMTSTDDPYLGSFQDAIDAGVPFVMVALATYTRIDPDHLAVFSPTVVRLLRDGMGFDGVIASDDMGAATAVAGITPAERALDFLSAGGDLIVSKNAAPTVAMASAVVAKASSDPAFGAVVDGAVLRILAAKDAYGLLPCSNG
jgi:beta-N-acetylhexosaminidase